MDSFIEQIIEKKAEPKDIIKRLLLMAGSLLLCFVFVYLAFMMPVISMVFFMMVFGTVWLTWILIQGTFIEYEYIITNNEMDIDKIISRKKRKRLITVKLNKTEEWGKYSSGKGENANVTVSAHDCGYKNLWYITVHHEKHGKTTLLFSPGRSVLQAVNKQVPYSLRKKELKENENNTADTDQTED